jgi:hypothetical protein
MRPLALDFFFFGTAIANSAFVNSGLTEKSRYFNARKTIYICALRANTNMAQTANQHHTEGKDRGNRLNKVVQAAPTTRHFHESSRAGLIVHP